MSVINTAITVDRAIKPKHVGDQEKYFLPPQGLFLSLMFITWWVRNLSS